MQPRRMYTNATSQHYCMHLNVFECKLSSECINVDALECNPGKETTRIRVRNYTTPAACLLRTAAAAAVRRASPACTEPPTPRAHSLP